MIAGVLGGVSEYFDIDPTIVRLLYVLLTVLTWIIPFLVIYILAIFIIPSE